jgi:hypothetical protein
MKILCTCLVKICEYLVHVFMRDPAFLRLGVPEPHVGYLCSRARDHGRIPRSHEFEAAIRFPFLTKPGSHEGSTFAETVTTHSDL